MATLQIKNFGPIKDSTKIELKSLMLLIGRQGAGKSAFMKVLCFCRWIEKRIMISADDLVTQYTHYNRFIKELKQFHRLNDEYFMDGTSISYDGDSITIDYTGINGNPKIIRKNHYKEKRYNSKLCYIPAERNLVSAIQNVDRAYKSTERDVLFNFIYEWDEARAQYTSEHPHKLAVTGGFSYVNKSGADMLRREDGSETPAFYVSSGVQSVMPLDVMANYITNCVGQKASLSMTDRNVILEAGNESASQRRLVYQSAQLFIEEPEQNLYPESQKSVVLSIVRSLRKAWSSGLEKSLVMVTTHSPYILSVINVLLAASSASEKGIDTEIVEDDCTLPLDAITGYFIGEDGIFQNILDGDVPMLSGNDLDGVSDWVDERISTLNASLYGKK